MLVSSILLFNCSLNLWWILHLWKPLSHEPGFFYSLAVAQMLDAKALCRPQVVIKRISFSSWLPASWSKKLYNGNEEPEADRISFFRFFVVRILFGFLNDKTIQNPSNQRRFFLAVFFGSHFSGLKIHDLPATGNMKKIRLPATSLGLYPANIGGWPLRLDSLGLHGVPSLVVDPAVRIQAGSKMILTENSLIPIVYIDESIKWEIHGTPCFFW